MRLTRLRAPNWFRFLQRGYSVERVGVCFAGVDAEDAGFVEGEGPAAVVGGVVVGGAEQEAVVPVGGTAVGPELDVVDFGPVRGQGAAGPAAAAVAGDDQGAQRGWDDAGAAADVEHFAAGGEDRQDDAVAGEPAGGVRAGGSGPGEPGSGEPAGCQRSGRQPAGCWFGSRGVPVGAVWTSRA